MAGTACTVVRRLSPAPLIRVITQQRVWPSDANIKVVETAASHHESIHSSCALTGGAVSTMREDIWGGGMAVVRIHFRQACSGMGGAKCGGHVACAAPARLVYQVAHAY